MNYLSEEQFSSVFHLAEKASRQLARFIAYLEGHPQAKRIRNSSGDYEV